MEGNSRSRSALASVAQAVRSVPARLGTTRGLPVDDHQGASERCILGFLTHDSGHYIPLPFHHAENRGLSHSPTPT